MKHLRLFENFGSHLTPYTFAGSSEDVKIGSSSMANHAGGRTPDVCFWWDDVAEMQEALGYDMGRFPESFGVNPEQLISEDDFFDTIVTKYIIPDRAFGGERAFMRLNDHRGSNVVVLYNIEQDIFYFFSE